MSEITLDLIRKHSEHNEGMITTLEELSLHQQELVSINRILGRNCRKLKILYLQNNIINKMEHLNHMKDLNYLNLALNNITKIEGLGSCEFLKKLDLTVNFVDVDVLEESIEHLRSRHHLEELYMMGNPSQCDWSEYEAELIKELAELKTNDSGGDQISPGSKDASEKKLPEMGKKTESEEFIHYVIACLPQLKYLDGTEITKSMRIVACQRYGDLLRHLRRLASLRREIKEIKSKNEGKDGSGTSPDKTQTKKKMGKKTKTKKAKKKKERGEDKRVTLLDDSGQPVVETDDEDDTDSEADTDSGTDGEEDGEGEQEQELTGHDPETRTKIYTELAQQKAEKVQRQRENEPRERDFEQEHREAVEKERKREECGRNLHHLDPANLANSSGTGTGSSGTGADGVDNGDTPGAGAGAGAGAGPRIKQCNQGKWPFHFDDYSYRDKVLLDISLPKHLDSSLVDADIHPNHVTVVVKGKVLRLELPCEVYSDRSEAKRSKTTGHLVLHMPKVREMRLGNRCDECRQEGGGRGGGKGGGGSSGSGGSSRPVYFAPKPLQLPPPPLPSSQQGRTKRRGIGGGGGGSLSDQLLQEAAGIGSVGIGIAEEDKCVDYRSIVKKRGQKMNTGTEVEVEAGEANMNNTTATAGTVLVQEVGAGAGVGVGAAVKEETHGVNLGSGGNPTGGESDDDDDLPPLID